MTLLWEITKYDMSLYVADKVIQDSPSLTHLNPALAVIIEQLSKAFFLALLLDC